MKKSFLFLFWVISLFTLSCGGSSSGGGSANSPTLTLLNFSANVQEGQSARVEFGYSDPDGNIKFAYIREQFREDLTSVFTAQGLFISGNSGSAFFTIAFPRDSRGQHSFEFWLLDADGNRSNILAFIINVT